MSWQPRNDYAITFSDQTGEERSPEQLEEMVNRMTEIANEYGFNIESYDGSGLSLIRQILRVKRIVADRPIDYSMFATNGARLNYVNCIGMIEDLLDTTSEQLRS